MNPRIQGLNLTLCDYRTNSILFWITLVVVVLKYFLSSGDHSCLPNISLKICL